jgi:hypothetical protein
MVDRGELLASHDLCSAAVVIVEERVTVDRQLFEGV